MLYKPELAYKIHDLLNNNAGNIEMLMTCCQHDPSPDVPSQVINVCPGCDKRFRADYKNCSTISLWEVLAEAEWFDFPDYKNRSMTIIDACPTRDQFRVHEAIRKLLRRMNINLVEPEKTRERSTCCGDSFYGTIPTVKVKEQMIKKANELPIDDVIVYCVSCSCSIYNGGKKPHYLPDLLFGEETFPHITDPDAWHDQLRCYIEKH
jgi:Fe-S oxidoreductase